MTDTQLAEQYTYRVTWSPTDGQHIGRVDEFPSLTTIASTPAEALTAIVVAVTSAVAELHRAGEQPPRPYADRDYSGKFQVRVGKDRHRRLAQQAERDHRSINGLILELIDHHLPEDSTP